MNDLIKKLIIFFVLALLLANPGFCEDKTTGSQTNPMNNVTSLTLVQTLPTGIEPLSIAFAPTSQSFAITNSDNTVMVYTFNSTTGSFELAQTLPTGNNPRQIAFSNDNKLAVVLNSYDNTLSIYTVDASTGQFTLSKVIGAGHQPTSIAIAPNNQFALITNGVRDNYSISLYAINTANQSFSLKQTETTGTFPQGVVISNDSTLAANVNYLDQTVTVYTVNSNNINNIQTINMILYTTSIAISPDRKLAAIGSFGIANNNFISVYKVDSASGKFKYLNQIVNGGTPGSEDIIFLPIGNAAVSCYDANKLALYGVNPDGTFSQLQILFNSNGFQQLACSPNGKLVVAISGQPGNPNPGSALVYQTSSSEKD